MARHLMVLVVSLAVLALGACTPSPAPAPSGSPHAMLGSIVTPTSCDAGLFVGGNGQGVPLSCQNPGLIRNSSNPIGLPLFSPVTTTEKINANGDNLNGGGHFFACNAGGTPCGNTHGVGFWVNDDGHQATGVRFYWQGDATWESATTVRCRLWDFRGTGTSVATGTISVTMHQEYSCTFGTPFTMVSGRPYAASIVDIGPCSPGGCVFGATLMNSVGVDQSCGNMYANNGGIVYGSPWLIFTNVETGVTGEHYTWPDLISGAAADTFPKGQDNTCAAIEPIVQ